jgi:tetratricopeptide (TPR) repeat protein
MHKNWITIALVLALSAGCASNKATQKNAAKEQWNQARAGVLASLARDQYRAGNFDNCEKTIKEALALAPRSPQLHTLYAKLAIEQGHLELADSELKITRTLDPKDSTADYLSGVVQQRWANPKGALTCYEAALAKNPNELSYLLAKAETLVALDQSEQALTILQERVVYFEHSAAIRDAIGALLMQKGDVPAAIEMYRQATILVSDDPTLREHLALAMLQGGHAREAEEILSDLVKDDAFARRGDLWIALGEARLQGKETRTARDAFETAAQLEPASPQIFLCIAKVAMQTQDFRRVELALRKALSLDESSGEANLMLGYLRLKQDRFEEALHAFRRSATLDPSDSVSQCMIGFALNKLGHRDEAVRYYGRVLQSNPKDPLAAHLMASINTMD